MIDLRNLRRVAATALGVTAAVQAGTAAVALPKGRRDYVDVVWGPGLGAIAISSALVGSGDARRRWALAAVVGGWAARLGAHVLPRMTGHDEEDPRYAEWLEGDSTARVIGKVFVMQGAAQLAVSLPVQVAAASTLPRSARRLLLPAGIVMAAGGAVLEAVADRQKEEYTATPKEDRPQVLDTGVWGISRHPNYLGDSLVWDGVWLAAAASSPGGWTWPAPALMSYVLIQGTGARLTERRMEGRPGYADYQRRVPFFFPDPRRLLGS